MNKIISLVLVLFLVPLVLADVDVGIDIQTTDLVNLGIGIDAGGDVDVTIDGVNWNEELDSLHTSIGGGFDVYRLSNHMRTVTGIIKGIEDGNDAERQIAYDLSTTFMTMRYLDYIKYNSYRLDIIETFLIRQFPTEYCDVVKEFVKKNGFKMLRCGNSTIISTSYGTLTVNDFPAEIKEEIVEEPKPSFVVNISNELFKQRIVRQYDSYMLRCESENYQYFCRLAENLKKAYQDFFISVEVEEVIVSGGGGRVEEVI